MATTRIVPREILISFEDDGTLRGAHYVLKGQVFADDGTLLGEKDMAPVPYTDAADDAFKSVLGDALSAALAQNTTLNARISALTQELETKG